MKEFNENLDFISVSGYDAIISEGSEDNMNSKEALVAALKYTGKTQVDAAKCMGWIPQQLANRLTRGTLRADELLRIMDEIGVDVKFVVRESGKEVKAHIKGHGRRIKAMVDGVTFDTSKSDALSNNFYADSENEYNDGKALELYVDSEGRYFFAEYTTWENCKDRISPVTSKDAAMFIEKYGTQIEKQPVKESDAQQ